MDGSLEWQTQWQRRPRLGTAVSVTVSISGAAAGLTDVAPACATMSSTLGKPNSVLRPPSRPFRH
jgi:hypothetical protein